MSSEPKRIDFATWFHFLIILYEPENYFAVKLIIALQTDKKKTDSIRKKPMCISSNEQFLDEVIPSEE